nr:hypothetical protein [Tanacetum cinerariifolium]
MVTSYYWFAYGARVFESEREWGWEGCEGEASFDRGSVDMTKSNTDVGTGLFTESDGTLIDANPLKEVVSPFVIDEHVAMEVQCPLVAQTYSVQSHVVEETVAMECFVVNTPYVGPNPPLPMLEANLAGNAPGKSSYATATGISNRKKVKVRTLFTPGGNGIDVVVSVDYIRVISARFANTAYGFSWKRRWHTLLLLTMLGILGLNMGLFAQCSARLLDYSLYNLAPWCNTLKMGHSGI